MSQDGYMQVYHGGSSFNDQLPWGQRFGYSKSNIEWPRDYGYYVTVVYSSKNISTYSDKYLHAWFNKHPALVSLRKNANFYETHATDPAYQSYLQSSLPITPAVLITKPPVPGRGYFGEVVYCAYGQYLSSDPNVIAKEIQTALSITADRDRYAAAKARESRGYGYHVNGVSYNQQYPRMDPRYPDYPPQYPSTQYPQRYPQQYPQYQQYPPGMLPPVIPEVDNRDERGYFNDVNLSTLALIAGGCIVVYTVLNNRGTRRRRRRR